MQHNSSKTHNPDRKQNKYTTKTTLHRTARNIKRQQTKQTKKAKEENKKNQIKAKTHKQTQNKTLG